MQIIFCILSNINITGYYHFLQNTLDNVIYSRFSVQGINIERMFFISKAVSSQIITWLQVNML